MIRLHRRLLALLLSPLVALAADGEDMPAIGLHGQATWIRQLKPAFEAPYSGPNSLRPGREWSLSFTGTLDLGVRLWDGAQLHVNPEAAKGVPLSALMGAGGISNGELQRGGTGVMRGYLARAFVQQRIDAGGERERVQADFNELGGQAAQRHWTLTGGLVSLVDFFDPNPYAKDPREQFVNWSFLTHGAWDYAADARGYTFAAIAEYRGRDWALRIGRAAQPRESNGLRLDHDVRRQSGDQIELEADLPWRLPPGPMRGRVLVFRNRVDGGAFADAIAQAGPGVPQFDPVRRLQDKRGWGLTLEAPLAEDAGVFLRASRNDGHVETYAFTEIDRQLSVGSQFTGGRWARPKDRWGLAYAVNGLSPAHRGFLARGGLGAFLGDGALRYGTERIAEGYYRWVLPELGVGGAPLQNAFSAGLQHIANPGYNQDRGPVNVWTVRWHSQF